MVKTEELNPSLPSGDYSGGICDNGFQLQWKNRHVLLLEGIYFFPLCNVTLGIRKAPPKTTDYVYYYKPLSSVIFFFVRESCHAQFFVHEVPQSVVDLYLFKADTHNEDPKCAV